MKTKRNVTNFEYVSVKGFHIKYKNFSGDDTNSCTFRHSFDFFFQKRKKQWNSSYEFLNINKFIKNKKEYVIHLIIEQLLFYQFINNFSALLLCKINSLDIFDMGDFDQIFVISWSTEILIQSKFWLEIYTPYIPNLVFTDSHH